MSQAWLIIIGVFIVMAIPKFDAHKCEKIGHNITKMICHTTTRRAASKRAIKKF